MVLYFSKMAEHYELGKKGEQLTEPQKQMNPLEKDWWLC